MFSAPLRLASGLRHGSLQAKHGREDCVWERGQTSLVALAGLSAGKFAFVLCGSVLGRLEVTARNVTYKTPWPNSLLGLRLMFTIFILRVGLQNLKIEKNP